jgi:DNA polymerase elongation subunit (family B)
MGLNLKPKDFNSMRDAKGWIDQYKDVWDIHGTTNYVHQFNTKRFPNDIKFDKDKINIMIFDIEVASADGFPYPETANDEVISIAARTSNDGMYYIWGLGDYDISKCDLEPDTFRYVKCKSELDLLTKFINWWNNPNHTPDVLTGWNIEFFDIPYLINRVCKIFGEEDTKLFSPWGIINEQTVTKFNREQQKYELVGIQTLDYWKLFTKFGYSYGPQESYSLDHISSVVLGENKLSYEEHGSLHSLYLNDYQKFIDYNIKDVQLVQRIDEKMELIALAMTIAYKAGVNYTDTFGTTAIWDSIIYRKLNNQNIIVPPNDTKSKGKFAGGYVKDPVPGLYDNVASFDLNSLYPNIIVQYNISPETLITTERYYEGVDTYLEKAVPPHPKYCNTVNGTLYSKEKRGFLPEIIIDYYDERAAIKKIMLAAESDYQKNPTFELEKEISQLHNKQMAIKILMNSMYGALGSQYFRYFDIRLAEAITLTGQYSIRLAERAVNTELNKLLNNKKDYVIAIDTDSVYINFNDWVKKFNPPNPMEFLDKTCSEHFEKVIAKEYDKLKTNTNAYENRMWMGREVLADKGIWTAKKRYILNVHNSEGVQYKEPKLKIMGIQAIQSSTPHAIREKLKESFKIIISGSEPDTQKFIAEAKSEFKKLRPEELAFPRGITEIKKYADRRTIYKKGTPIHCRGSLLYNKMVKDLGLTKKYELIQGGDKVKFVYLKLPNVLRENVIAFKDYLPPEFNLENNIDYNTQFDKVFNKPLEPILAAVKWTAEESINFEDMFG